MPARRWSGLTAALAAAFMALTTVTGPAMAQSGSIVDPAAAPAPDAGSDNETLIGEAEAPAADGFGSKKEKTITVVDEIPREVDVDENDPQKPREDYADRTAPTTSWTVSCTPSNPATPTCVNEDDGWVYRPFAKSGYGGVGNAYDPESLPLATDVVIEGHWANGFRPVPGYTTYDDDGTPIVIPDRRVPVTNWVDARSWRVYANPAVYPALTDKNGRVCTSRHSFPGVFTESGQTFSAPYVGYRVYWYAAVSTSSSYTGMMNDYSTYECELPAIAQQQMALTCYRWIEGTVDAFMPNPQTPTGPPARLAGLKTGAYPDWKLRLPRKWTKYGRIITDLERLVASGEGNTEEAMNLKRAAYSACTNQENKLGYPVRDVVSDWPWGRYDLRLAAAYDTVTAVRFATPDMFGGWPRDFIVLDRSQLFTDHPDQRATFENPATNDPTKVWRTVVHQYCEPTSLRTAPDSAFAYLNYINTQPFWRNGKELPDGITYTADDCAPPTTIPTPTPIPDAVNGSVGTWTCVEDGFGSFDGASRNSTTLQSLADNLRRNAVWNPITIAGEGTTVRNIREQTVTYLAADESSPRLTGSDVYAPGRQPFTFTPPLGDPVTGWDTAQRTLGTQFKEASRDGETFTVWPFYRFVADFLSMTLDITSYDVNTGTFTYTTKETWTPSPGTCTSDPISIDVQRVGSITTPQ